MNDKNSELLRKEFPELFRNRPYFGFACGDGWFTIIYKLCAAIDSKALAAGLSRDSDQWPEVAQVKEKFGALRFYFHTALDYQLFAGAVREAESESARTCEMCGNPGRLVGKPYQITLCADCEK